MQRIGWGILGAGRIAGAFAGDLSATGHRLAAVGSRDASRAADFARTHGIPASHGSYEALAADPSVDVVYVATPHSMHLEHARIAIDAGKHVLVEKAFTTTADEARQLVAAARERGVFAMEAMWTRFLPTSDAVRAAIARGDLGEVTKVVADHSQALDQSPGSRLIEPALGGGALLDLGVYTIAFAHDLLGPVVHVTARGVTDAKGVDHRSSIILQHTGGGMSTHTADMGALGSNRAVVAGTGGAIELDPAFYGWTSFSRRVPGEDGVAERFEPAADRVGRGMQFQAAEVERCIAAGLGESPRMPLDETVAILDVMDAVRRQIGQTSADRVAASRAAR